MMNRIQQQMGDGPRQSTPMMHGDLQVVGMPIGWQTPGLPLRRIYYATQDLRRQVWMEGHDPVEVPTGASLTGYVRAVLHGVRDEPYMRGLEDNASSSDPAFIAGFLVALHTRKYFPERLGD